MFGKYDFKGANKRSDIYYCEMQRIQKYEYIFVNYMRTYMFSVEIDKFLKVISVNWNFLREINAVKAIFREINFLLIPPIELN